jgi:hypothetical protein
MPACSSNQAYRDPQIARGEIVFLGRGLVISRWKRIGKTVGTVSSLPPRIPQKILKKICCDDYFGLSSVQNIWFSSLSTLPPKISVSHVQESCKQAYRDPRMELENVIGNGFGNGLELEMEIQFEDS